MHAAANSGYRTEAGRTTTFLKTQALVSFWTPESQILFPLPAF
jgi:hypothetical protein